MIPNSVFFTLASFFIWSVATVLCSGDRRLNLDLAFKMLDSPKDENPLALVPVSTEEQPKHRRRRSIIVSCVPVFGSYTGAKEEPPSPRALLKGEEGSDRHHYPKLHKIARDNPDEAIRLIDESVMDASVLDSEGNNIVHLAINFHKFDLLRYLVDRDDVEWNTANYHGERPLGMALRLNSEKMALALISRSQVSLLDLNNKGDSALHLVARTLHTLDILAELLIRVQPNIVNVTNQNEEIPLHTAVQSGSDSLIIFLAKYSNAQAIMKNGDSALHLTLKKSRFEVVNALIRAGSPLNLPDGNNQTPMDLALNYATEEDIVLLMESTAKFSDLTFENDDEIRSYMENTNRLPPALLEKLKLKELQITDTPLHEMSTRDTEKAYMVIFNLHLYGARPTPDVDEETSDNDMVRSLKLRKQVINIMRRLKKFSSDKLPMSPRNLLSCAGGGENVASTFSISKLPKRKPPGEEGDYESLLN